MNDAKVLFRESENSGFHLMINCVKVTPESETLQSCSDWQRVTLCVCVWGVPLCWWLHLHPNVALTLAGRPAVWTCLRRHHGNRLLFSAGMQRWFARWAGWRPRLCRDASSRRDPTDRRRRMNIWGATLSSAASLSRSEVRTRPAGSVYSHAGSVMIDKEVAKSNLSASGATEEQHSDGWWREKLIFTAEEKTKEERSQFERKEEQNGKRKETEEVNFLLERKWNGDKRKKRWTERKNAKKEELGCSCS